MEIGHSNNNDCFCIDDDIIQTVNSVKDFGIHISSSLNFSTHVNLIVPKAQARANLTHKCFLSKDPSTLMNALTM